MRIEPAILPIKNQERKGWIEMITGCMFSGKTEELILRLNKAKIAGHDVEIFKPKVERRYSEKEVVSHNEKRIASNTVDFANDILKLGDHCQVVGIDEAQFFDIEIVVVANLLANRNKRVIISGLDMDYLGKPFNQLANLLAIADQLTKFQAVCVRCGRPANYSHRLINSNKRVVIGAKEAYEPRCRNCFYEGLEKK